MAISRAQMEEQIKGFAPGGINNVDPFDDYTTGTDLKPLDMTQFEDDSEGIGQASPSLNSEYLRMLTKALSPVDYETQSARYQERLKGLYEPPDKLSFYDLLSDLGAGIMSQPPTAGAFPGIAAGFNTFSARMRADRDERRKQRQAIALEAAKLAMEDERKAEERIQKFAMDMIQNQNFGDADLVTLSYDEVDAEGQFTGRRITRSFDKKSQGKELQKILRTQNPVVVSDLPDEAAETTLSKEDAKAVSKEQTELNEIADKAFAQLDNLTQAELIAGDLGKEGFGRLEQISLPFRQFFVPMLPWLGVDLGRVSKQEALATITIGFALANVSQTKGAVSNAEMELFKESAPFLGQTYEGFLRSIDIQRRAAKKKQEFVNAYTEELGRFTEEARKRNRKLDGTQVRGHMGQWKRQWRADKKDLFLTEEDKRFIEKAKADAKGKKFYGNYEQIESRFKKFQVDQERRSRADAEAVSAMTPEDLRRSIEDNPDLSREQKDVLLEQIEGM